MAETEGVQIKITGDGSQAMRELGRIKAAMEQLRALAKLTEEEI